MEVWELVAREGVRETVIRYAHLVDGGRFDELLELFTEDATLEAGDQTTARGRAAIRALFVDTGARLSSAQGRPFVRHHVSNIDVDVESPDAARARAYFLALTEHGPDHWGRYQDRLVRVDGRWRFQHRRVRTEGRVAGSVLNTKPGD
jgi:3-phenylpropionate/cinnamic acid dioxygenase small subunit